MKNVIPDFRKLTIIAFSIFAFCALCRGGEMLYNGIQLPAQWPPKPKQYFSAEAVTPPYLKSPPRVIPIDVGRQLFVDDFLIEKTTLKRVHHLAEYYKGNPVLKAEKTWETIRGKSFAAPFSGGVVWDPADKLLKMWYLQGYGYSTGYATSKDGIHWVRPDISEGSNALKIHPTGRDSSAVWLDLETRNPNQRYKMVRHRAGQEFRTSADGINWSAARRLPKRFWGDRSTFFYNPFRKVWVMSGRLHHHGRVRGYQECRDFDFPALDVKKTYSKWMRADGRDKVTPGPYAKKLPDLYNLDCLPYESLMLGMFNIHSEDANKAKKRPKINYISLGYSRDGFHWSRPDRRAFMDVKDDPKAWNYGNLQSALGLLVMGDKLYFYCSGRQGGSNLDEQGTTGLAILRRDGFVSMEGTGELTTRPVTFKGGHLFVNVDCPEGELRVEVLSEKGESISSFSKSNCKPVKADSTIRAITWKDGDLSRLVGKKVRFKFHLKNGKLYSFWVSPDASGASHGYAGTGGPGFTSHKDTVGKAAYQAVP